MFGQSGKKGLEGLCSRKLQVTCYGRGADRLRARFQPVANFLPTCYWQSGICMYKKMPALPVMAGAGTGWKKVCDRLGYVLFRK